MRLLAILFFCSCVVSNLPEENDTNLEQNNSSSGYQYNSNKDKGSSLFDCAGTEVVEITINGQESYIEVPVLCNPNQIDKGDPEPFDRSPINHISSNPIEKIQSHQ